MGILRIGIEMSTIGRGTGEMDGESTAMRGDVENTDENLRTQL